MEKREDKYLKYIKYNNPVEVKVEIPGSLRRVGLPDQSSMHPPSLAWEAKRNSNDEPVMPHTTSNTRVSYHR